MSYTQAVPVTLRESAQRSSRQGAAIDHIILHHCATNNVAWVLDAMTSGSKQVSANYVVSNEGKAFGVVDEQDRAWTSGSSTDGGKGAAWDRRSITFEIENQTLAPDWFVSDAAHETVARICADVSRRYGFPLNRDTVLGHRDLWTRFRASYATACPGGLDIDRIIRRANQLKTVVAAEDLKEIIVATVNEIWNEKLGGSAGVDTVDKEDVEAWRGLSRTYRRVTQTLGLLTELAPLIRKLANDPAPVAVNVTIDDATAELIAQKVAAKVNVPTSGTITLQ